MATRIWAYVNSLSRRKAIDAEVDDELRFHIEMETQANIARGMTPTEARRMALRDFGGVTQTKEAVRQTRAGWIDSIVRDVRHALRMLARNPRFTAAAVLTLALGIGANAAIFGIVDAALFRPIPYKDADRLVLVGRNAWIVDGPNLKSVPDFASGRDADRMRAFTGVFEDFGAYRWAIPAALATGIDQNLRVGGFTPNFPKLLGVSPEIGRAFTRDDVQAQDAIIVSDGFWQRAFNRVRYVMGKTLAFPDRTYVVVGVMPPTFRLFGGAQTDAWLPIDGKDGNQLVARLRPGLTFAQAERTLKSESKRLPAPTYGGKSYPLEFGIVAPDWERGAQLPAGFVERPQRRMLLSLMAAVGFVLLIACANVANLLLLRTLARQNEIAVRRALGATRAQLARQFVIEGFVLAGLGGVVAMFVAWCGIRAIPSLAPPDLIPTLLGVSLPRFDLRVLAFAGLAVLVAGISSGVASAIRASGWAADRGLLSGGRRIAGSRGQRRVRHAFQAVQIALTLVLLTGAGLFINSFVRMVSVPVGFDSRQLASVNFNFPRKEFASMPQQVAFVNELAARVSRMPGVVGASVGPPPIWGGGIGTDRLVPDGDASRGTELRTNTFWVGPQYFRVAGIALKQGRTFSEHDRQDNEPVVILSDSIAARLWPGRNPVGRQVDIENKRFTVVGLVPRLRTTDLAKDSVEVFVAAEQCKYGTASLVLRTTGDADRVAAIIRAEARAINPRVTVQRISTVDRLFAEFDPFGSSRFYAVMLGGLAVLGLLTAAVGLYAFMSFAVRHRTHEIGVRIALGADSRSLRRLLGGDAIWPVSLGVAAGLLAAWSFSKLLASQLYHVTPHDPATLAAVVGLLLVVCALTVLAPVRQATHTNPVDALRED